jgi:hypothetical protein
MDRQVWRGYIQEDRPNIRLLCHRRRRITSREYQHLRICMKMDVGINLLAPEFVI